MAKSSARVAVLTSSVLFVVASAAAEPSANDRAGNELDCARVTAEARNYGYGYNHVLTLSNQCQRAVSCEVWTNVDPTPHLKLDAKPGQSASIIARVGSPSRNVQAGKSCKFQ